MPLDSVTKASAESTRVFLDPPSQTVSAVGDSFAVNVSIADVSNLYGYQFKLYYDSTIMNGTGQPTEGSFLSSGGGQTFFDTVSFTDNYNSPYGVVWITGTLTGSVPGVSGGGVLAAIEFKSLIVAASTPLHLDEVVLLDSNVSQISYQGYDGTVTVVPEFTSLFAVLALILASSFGILVGKQAMRKPGISNQGRRSIILDLQLSDAFHGCTSRFFFILIVHTV
ncbi:MAG: cohesin domain-containing protein [Candidatus Bathyarchaeia archaeon]